MAKSLNWKLLREEYRLTDLSLTAFAKEKGIARSTAVNHLKDIDDEKKNERLEAEQTEDENGEIEGFVPIEILDQEASLIESAKEVTFIKTSVIEKETAANVPPLELTVSDFSITLPKGFDKNTLRDALEVIRGLC